MKQIDFRQLLIDQSKDLIWIVNSDFQVVYANETYFNLMKEATGQEKKLNESVFVEAFGEEDVTKWKAYYERTFKGESFEIEEHFLNPKSNQLEYSQTTFKPIHGEGLEIIAVSCESRDITEKVKVRSEINHLMDASLDVFCTVDEEGNFVHVSNACTVLWGYTPAELIGKPYVNYILEADITKSTEIANDILNGKEIKSFVNRYKKKGGGIAYNLWSAKWDNTSKLVTCVARDAKEKIEAEVILFNSEQRFKALVQDGADLVGIVNPEGDFIYVSPTIISVLGITPEEMTGKNAFDYIHPEDVKGVFDSLQKLFTVTKVVVDPFRFRHNDEDWR